MALEQHLKSFYRQLGWHQNNISNHFIKRYVETEHKPNYDITTISKEVTNHKISKTHFDQEFPKNLIFMVIVTLHLNSNKIMNNSRKRNFSRVFRHFFPFFKYPIFYITIKKHDITSCEHDPKPKIDIHFLSYKKTPPYSRSR